MKRPKLTPLCSPRAVWTPPRGVSTSIFGDSLQEFTQKSETVDMWTSVCLIILKASSVHQLAWGPGRPEVNQAPEPDPLTAAGTLGGALSLSTGTVLRFRQVRFEGKGKIAVLICGSAR